MKIQRLIITLILVLSFSFVAVGKSPGTYIIPPGSQATTSTVDSILTYLADTTNTVFSLNKDSLGELMWYSKPYQQYVSTNKLKATTIICTENNFVRIESQYDTSLKKVDYETKTVSLDSTGNELWTETIDVEVVDSTEIIINSPVDVTAEIYKAYDIINPTYTQLAVEGNGTNQNFSVNLDSGATYIIVFIENENSIVSIKRVGV